MSVEFNSPITLLAFAAFNKSGLPNASAAWGNAGEGYQDPSVNWLGYVGQNASGIRYAFAYGFTTPSWQGDATQLTLRINLAEELGRDRTIRWALTTSNPMYLGNAYAQQDLPADSGRIDDGVLEITASTRAQYTISIDLTGINLQPNSTYYLVLSPYTTSSGTSNYCSVPNKDAYGNVYTAQDILDGAVTYEADASGVTAPDGYFGQQMTIAMDDDGLSKTLTYSCAGGTGTIGTTSGASITWTPPTSLMARIPADSSAECTITCTTLAGETSCSCTLYVPESVKPSIGSVSLDIVNASVTVDQWGICLQNFSQIETQFYAAAHSSTRLVSWRIDGGAFSLEGTISNTRTYTGDELSGVLAAAGTYTVKVTVTDQRGRSSTKTVGTYTVQPYTVPTATGVDVFRCDSSGTADDEGTYLYAIATRSYTQVGNNTCAMYFEYKEVSSNTWTRHPTAMQDNTGIVAGGGNINPLKTYNTRIYVEDSLGGAYVYINISTQAVAFNLRATERSGAAFGGYAETDGYVELKNGWKLNAESTQHITFGSGQNEQTLEDLLGGGGGGTTNYNDLSNKPSIAGVELSGNKAMSSFGLVTSVSAQSTDTQFPSAKLFYDTCGDIESALAALIGGS